MQFNSQKAEEKVLTQMLLERFDEMKKSGKYTFEDGALVSEFINNSIEWYRHLKALAYEGDTSTYGKYLLDSYNPINTKYGFNITIDLIQDNTIYESTNVSFSAK
jgi:hypothetical protein